MAQTSMKTHSKVQRKSAKEEPLVQGGFSIDSMNSEK